MDSKIVNKAIREEIRPFLKEAGFSKFSTKSAWRYSENLINVIIIESFNSYNAAVLRCTPYSFQVEVGCYFPSVPSTYGSYGPKEKDGVLLPHYAHCYFARPLYKTLTQPECGNKRIWYIDEKGKYLGEALSDLKKVIRVEGLPWFDQFSSSEKVMMKLEEMRLSYKGDEAWDYGNKPSSVWLLHAGYIALWIKNYELALKYLKAIDKSDFSDSVLKQLKEDIKNVERQIVGT
ncbi:MAG: hypothetical protein HZA15_16640 [Nitrospirae bacterium]|nr:hypothetical protein [Nitrospirota bacterium]